MSSESKRGKSHVRSMRAERRPAHLSSVRTHPGFVVVPDHVEEPISVSVRQTIVAPSPEPKKTETKKMYIAPRWMKTEAGVLVLEPGRWIAVEPGAEY